MMPKTKIEFGFYPRRLEVKAGFIEIETNSGFDEIVAECEVWEGVEKNWQYPLPRHERTFDGKVRELPYASRIFGLPKTHALSHACADNQDHLRFHVWMLSFFLGMRLTTTEAGFLDATPIKPGMLVDFILSNVNLTKAIEFNEAFWVRHRLKPECSKRLIAAIHALFLAHNPQHLQFEQFIYLYTSIDACYALMEAIKLPPRRPSHADRINWICKNFGIDTPSWAQRSPFGAVEVASLRNFTLHEALFADEPLGFGVQGVGASQNLMLEMEAFICRIIVALLGGETTSYVRSAVNTRSSHLLEFP